MINIGKRDKINIVTFKTDTINALITDEIGIRSLRSLKLPTQGYY